MHPRSTFDNLNSSNLATVARHISQTDVSLQFWDFKSVKSSSCRTTVFCLVDHSFGSEHLAMIICATVAKFKSDIDVHDAGYVYLRKVSSQVFSRTRPQGCQSMCRFPQPLCRFPQPLCRFPQLQAQDGVQTYGSNMFTREEAHHTHACVCT